MTADDIRADLPRFHSANVEKNLELRRALDAIARRKNATLTQLRRQIPGSALRIPSTLKRRGDYPNPT
jgi:hypothetical protein